MVLLKWMCFVIDCHWHLLKSHPRSWLYFGFVQQDGTDSWKISCVSIMTDLNWKVGKALKTFLGLGRGAMPGLSRLWVRGKPIDFWVPRSIFMFLIENSTDWCMSERSTHSGANSHTKPSKYPVSSKSCVLGLKEASFSNRLSQSIPSKNLCSFNSWKPLPLTPSRCLGSRINKLLMRSFAASAQMRLKFDSLNLKWKCHPAIPVENWDFVYSWTLPLVYPQ